MTAPYSNADAQFDAEAQGRCPICGRDDCAHGYLDDKCVNPDCTATVPADEMVCAECGTPQVQF